MQSTSSKIWTRILDSISFGDNRYTEHASLKYM